MVTMDFFVNEKWGLDFLSLLSKGLIREDFDLLAVVRLQGEDDSAQVCECLQGGQCFTYLHLQLVLH